MFALFMPSFSTLFVFGFFFTPILLIFSFLFIISMPGFSFTSALFMFSFLFFLFIPGFSFMSVLLGIFFSVYFAYA